MGASREYKNILPFTSRAEFREWLNQNAATEGECWLALKRGKPTDSEFSYLDAVEEALCFGWIDSTLASVNGVCMQRFSPRRKSSGWTALNYARAKRLEALGLMTDLGRCVLPDCEPMPDQSVTEEIKSAGVWEEFCTLPELYRKIRLHNLSAAKKRSLDEYKRAFENFVKNTKLCKTYGEWNDYGRLI